MSVALELVDYDGECLVDFFGYVTLCHGAVDSAEYALGASAADCAECAHERYERVGDGFDFGLCVELCVAECASYVGYDVALGCCLYEAG